MEPSLDSANMEQRVQEMVRRRGHIKSSITRIETFVNNFDLNVRQEEELQERMKLLTKKMEEFEQVQCFLEMQSDRNTEEMEEYRAEVEDTVCTVTAKIRSILKTSEKENKTNESYTEIPLSTNVQLPKIKLTSFDGQIGNWNTFRSLYDSLVHNNNRLTPSQKFQYLLSSLTPNVAAMISNLKLDDNTYPIAYETLVNRYSNPRLLASHYFSEIQNFRSFDNKKPTVEGLQTFLSTHMNAFNALHELKNIDIADFLEFSMALHNIDPSTRNAFEDSLQAGELPTVKRLFDFITERLRSMEIRQIDESVKVVKPRNLIINHSKSKQKDLKDNCLKNITCSSGVSKPQDFKRCALCSKTNHYIQDCFKFIELDIANRYEEVRRNRLCYLCLQRHNRVDCTSDYKCFCGSKRHHALLHNPSQSTTDVTGKTSSRDDGGENSSEHHILFNSSTMSNPSPSTLLATASLYATDRYNNVQLIRSVIDPGSEINTITEESAVKLQLKINKTKTTILGFGANSTKALGTVDIKLASQYDSSFTFVISALVVKVITGNLPSTDLKQISRDHPARFALADEHYYVSRPIDLLLGCSSFALILHENSHVIPGQPYAMKTKLGWLLFGSINGDSCTPQRSLLTSIDRVGDALVKFWESEEIPEKRLDHPDDLKAEEIYVSTLERSMDGRYQTALPFRDESIRPGRNREITSKKYLSFEQRTLQDNNFREKYIDFMEEYKNLNHMTVTFSPASYVIPFHCVLRPSSTSTKLRTVFNGSATSNNGKSLNDCLLPGPKLQADLPSIILNFRLHNVVVCCDVKMMFRQILIRPDDRKYQHIFYRKNPRENIQEYQLDTIVYGLCCSPFLAQRTLFQIVRDHGEKYPLASEAITKFTYVDDIVYGQDTVQEAKQLVQELIDLLKCGCLELRKWTSNNEEVLSTLPSEHLENPHVFNEDNAIVKILGLQWLPSSDTFFYTVIPFDGKPTKRSILSYISKMFDSIGFVCPVTFWIKAFLQKLWLNKVDWDSELPYVLAEEWSQFAESLSLLTAISIPRQITTKNATKVLVGFCDASERGFAAAIYLHSTDEHGNVSTNLVAAKSRVAPLKVVTIPKLELCGAVLLARLMQFVIDSLNTYELKDIYLFTDAKTVLRWLATPPYLLKIYVANRISKILGLTKPEMWRYIPSSLNPADIASRGCSAKTLASFDLWWKGPIELQTNIEDWPVSKLVESQEPIPELKPTQGNVLTTHRDHSLLETFDRFSTYRKLINVFAYVLRFIRKCQKVEIESSTLTVEELNESKLLCVRLVQEQSFDSKCIERYKSLSIFVCDRGLYRVGGRIRNSTLPYDSRHPVLLPKHSHFTNLVCDHFHKIALHAGPRTTQSLILQQFWIISIRNVLRQIIHKCVKCFRFKGKPIQPVMADLPSCRITEARPFSNVGLDFAGPFTCKAGPYRTKKTYKGYLCVFICMSVKAAHLEFLSELSTAAFLAAFDRFISRRGLPRRVYSDNGTNFQGAARQLNEVWNMLSENQDIISSACASKQIIWHFNPPAGSNFGGLWEITVKIAKAHLKTLIGSSILSYEEYNTLFCRIESILNSRPLLDFSPDANEQLTTITPAHFLIGTSMLTPLEIDYSESKTLKCKWTLLRQMTQRFWKMWSKDYIHTQMQRNKWQKAKENLKIGQIVYIFGENTSPLDWPLGIINKLHPGTDGIIRVASVKTATKVLTRPINKLVPLPIEPV